MIRRINKIVSLVLITTSVSLISPNNIFNQRTNAAENNNSEINIDAQKNIVTMASENTAYDTVIKAMLPSKTGYSSDVISEFSKCGSISYTLDDTTASEIATTLKSNVSEITTEVTKLKNTRTDLASECQTVLTQLNAISSMSDSELTEFVKSEAKDITVYQYRGAKASSAATIDTEGFVVGGILGLGLSPVDTYNAETRTATYNSSNIVQTLSLTDGSTFKQSIDLSSSTNKVICDGLHINIIDSNNNKLYTINNPVYNMFKQSKSLYIDDDKKLSVLNFPSEVSNLSGYTTTINLSNTTQSVQTTILGLSLKVKNSLGTDKKFYKYVTPINSVEEEALNVVINKLGLSDSAKESLESYVRASTFMMVPDLKSDVAYKVNGVVSDINDTVDNITDAMGDLSDAVEDLSDSINDESDKVNDAWDKVTDRFDNDPGWATKDGYRYYYDKDGISLKGAQKIDGKTYYFNRIDGAMETGWQIVDSKKCYFDKDKGYEVFNQWVQDGDDWYFVDESGVVKKSAWVTNNGKTYYLKADGKMTKGWIKVDDDWYLLNDDGSMAASTWKWSDGKWYYLKSNGAAANGWTQIEEKWYCFKDSSGELQTGWFRNDGSWYCSGDDGAMRTGWADSSNGICYLDESTGKMKKSEWTSINGNWYYFNVNGIMVTGSKYIDGTKYTFNSDGTLA